MGVVVSKDWREPSEIAQDEKDEVLPRSDPLNNPPSIEHIADLIKSGQCKRIIVLAGAGISVSAGIPDFRTPGTGLYDNLHNYGLPEDEPTAIFDISYFKKNPLPFCQLAQEMYPKADENGKLKYNPTLTHHFIRLLHYKKLLHRCYTQNIDVLERQAGIPLSKLVECHGSFSGGHCTSCGNTVDDEWLKYEFFKGTIPKCNKLKTKLSNDNDNDSDSDNNDDNNKMKLNESENEEPSICGGYCKPDITFFGENLPLRFHELHEKDTECSQLLIVMGTSLNVAPVCNLPALVNPLCPRLFINREPCNIANPPEDYTSLDTGFRFYHKDNYRDVFFQGDCDDGVLKLCEHLGWKEELINMQNEFTIDTANNYSTEDIITEDNQVDIISPEEEDALLNDLIELNIKDNNHNNIEGGEQ